MLKTKISVALCTYNGEQYLREQIESILGQSIPPDEIVVTDDRSTDATVRILEDYAATTCLRYVVNESQLGFVKNFEKAILMCRGEFILLSDQDDVWKPDKIERLLEAINDHLLVYSNAQLVDARLNSLDKNLLDLDRIVPMTGRSNKAFVFQNCVSGNTLMFRRDLVDLALPFPDGIPFHDGYLAFIASTCGTIGYVDEPLVLYRQHASNVTDSAGIKGKKKKPKLEGKRVSNHKRIMFLKAFLSCQCLTETDRALFLSLLVGFEQYETSWFNRRLFKVLLQHKNDLFAMDRYHDTMKIVKLAYGLRLYQLFPFL